MASINTFILNFRAILFNRTPVRKVTEVLFLQNKNERCWKKVGPNHYCEPIRGAMIVRIVHFLRRPSFEQLIHKIRVRCFRITTNIKYPLCLYHIWTFCWPTFVQWHEAASDFVRNVCILCVNVTNRRILSSDKIVAKLKKIGGWRRREIVTLFLAKLSRIPGDASGLWSQCHIRLEYF